MIFKLTSNKTEHLKSEGIDVLNSTHSLIRRIAQVTGYLVASFPGVMFGQLHYHILERETSQAVYNTTEVNTIVALQCKI